MLRCHREIVIKCMLVGVLLLAGSFPARADDIALQVGHRFSVYSPSSCHRVEQAKFALALDCNFRGKAVKFYLKEFPNELNEEFDPRNNPPSRVHQQAYRTS